MSCMISRVETCFIYIVFFSVCCFLPCMLYCLVFSRILCTFSQIETASKSILPSSIPTPSDFRPSKHESGYAKANVCSQLLVLASCQTKTASASHNLHQPPPPHAAFRPDPCGNVQLAGKLENKLVAISMHSRQQPACI